MTPLEELIKELDTAITLWQDLKAQDLLQKESLHTEQRAIGFSKWRNGLSFAAQWESAGTTQARLKNDSELFKDYMESLKP